MIICASSEADLHSELSLRISKLADMCIIRLYGA